MANKNSQIVQTFIDLVQIDSPTGFEEGMTKEVFKLLKSYGLTPKIDKVGNVLVKILGDLKKEIYMLNAHLDTVEPGRGIKPYIKAGWIRSEGEQILGADNKTGVAVILDLLRKLTEEKNKTSHPLEIVFTVSEESGNHGAIGINYREIKAKKGYIFDASDRAFGDIIISSPFYNRFDIELVGVPAHASKPELAVNVLPIFTDALSKIKLGRVNEKTLANIGIVSSGQVVNTIPGSMKISGEVRSRDEKDLEKVTKNLIGVFEKSAKAGKVKCHCKVIRENGGYEFKKTDPFVKRTIDILNETKLKPNLIDSWGCYEANIFAEHGIMMLNLADGSLDTHTKDERIKVSDLERLGELVYKLVTV